MIAERTENTAPPVARRIVAKTSLMEGMLRTAQIAQELCPASLEERDIVVLAVSIRMFPHQKNTIMGEFYLDKDRLKRRLEQVESSAPLKEGVERTITILESEGLVSLEIKAPLISKPSNPAKPKITESALPAKQAEKAHHKRNHDHKKVEPPKTAFVGYKTRFKNKPKIKTGETDRRFKKLISEHALRYPDLPINLTALAAHMLVSKETTSNLWGKYSMLGAIPEGLKIIPQLKKPQKKSTKKT